MDDWLIRGLLWRARFGGCLLLGAMLLLGGGCRRDVATLEQAERQHPDLAAAREALSRGDREEAERRLTALLRRAPEMPQSFGVRSLFFYIWPKRIIRPSELVMVVNCKKIKT